MSLQRRIDWSASHRTLQADRVPAAVRAVGLAAQNAAKVEAMRARAGAALVNNGSFDRAAIMAMAVRNARIERQGRPALSWAAAMAETLRHAWACAKAARLGAIVTDARAMGATSLRALAAVLNAKGIPAPRGGQWSATQVQRVLRLSAAPPRIQARPCYQFTNC